VAVKMQLRTFPIVVSSAFEEKTLGLSTEGSERDRVPLATVRKRTRENENASPDGLCVPTMTHEYKEVALLAAIQQQP